MKQLVILPSKIVSKKNINKSLVNTQIVKISSKSQFIEVTGDKKNILEFF